MWGQRPIRLRTGQASRRPDTEQLLEICELSGDPRPGAGPGDAEVLIIPRADMGLVVKNAVEALEDHALGTGLLSPFQ